MRELNKKKMGTALANIAKIKVMRSGSSHPYECFFIMGSNVRIDMRSAKT